MGGLKSIFYSSFLLSRTDSDYIASGTLPLAGAELWSSSSADSSPDPPPPSLILPTPMICAEDNFRLSAWSDTMLQWRFLTRERVAAYHSHLMAVRQIVDDNAKARAKAKNPGSASSKEGEKAEKPRVALILEDDVDMEVDIEQRLEGLVPLLPENWDVLYLGKCPSFKICFPKWHLSINAINAVFFSFFSLMLACTDLINPVS